MTDFIRGCECSYLLRRYSEYQSAKDLSIYLTICVEGKYEFHSA
jgi:hypothetical protein